MVKIDKTLPAPRPITSSKDYQQGLVFETICKDFHCKCYLCEDRPTSINIEHIVPHKGDKALKYKWENLFFACAHCNNIKGTKYNNVIDCTKDDPEETIRFKFEPLPRTEPEFELKGANTAPGVVQTVELLNKIFCKPPTGMKTKEAIELCRHLYKEVKDFVREVEEYFDAIDCCANEDKCYTYVANRLVRSAPFAAFKRTLAREIYPDNFGKALEK